MQNRHSPSRIPCLDGLRAIAIGAVLLAHATGTRGLPVFPGFQWLGNIGDLGVRVFFVISGFLITHLLLAEMQETGGIGLRTFYIRRAFRIFPAFYVFIAFVTIFWTLRILNLKPSHLVYAATYTINYIPKKSWNVGHLWSLAVEEQFYLLWPALLAVAGLKRSKSAAIAAVAVAPILRVCIWYLLPEKEYLINRSFPTVMDSIATGCLLACFRQQLWNNPIYRRLLESQAIIAVPIIVMVANYLSSHTRPDIVLGQTVRNFGVAICIDWSVRNWESRMGRILNSKALVFLGTLSYSLYLWQQVFLNSSSSAIFCAFPLNLVLAFLFASLSFYIIERPCLRWRSRLFPEFTRKIPSNQVSVTGEEVPSFGDRVNSLFK